MVLKQQASKITTDKLHVSNAVLHMNLIFNTRFQLPSSLRAVKYNFNMLVNSQMQCSHVIQTQAQKCDGMHINFDAVYQGHSKFAREPSKTQTALIDSIFSDERTRHFDALTYNLFFCAYSGLQNTLKIH